MLKRCFFVAAAWMFLALGANGQSVASRPPMGWNSWDSYGLTVGEAAVKENAKAMQRDLAPFGWNLVVVDEGWYFTNPENRPNPEKLQYTLDRFGRFIPASGRFPSAATKGHERADGQSLFFDGSDGFRALADWLHSRKLLFGIHIIRGVPRESVRLNLPIANSRYRTGDAADQTSPCPWDPTSWGVKDDEAGQAWYDSLIAQYSSWGVDFLKVDCIADHPYRLSEIRQIHAAIAKNGGKMVLSLSPGPTALEHANEVKKYAQLWRVSNDVWDEWSSTHDFPISVKSQFARLAEWASFAGPGSWPDADMLPFGMLTPKPDVGPGPRHSRLTLDEEHTQLTLWAFARSPLILGANLTQLDAPTRELLTNKDILRINQQAISSGQLFREDDLVVWRDEMPDGKSAIALFNLSDEPMKVDKSLQKLGLRAGVSLRNIWSGEPVAQKDSFAVTIAPHATVALVEQ